MIRCGGSVEEDKDEEDLLHTLFERIFEQIQYDRGSTHKKEKTKETQKN